MSEGKITVTLSREQIKEAAIEYVAKHNPSILTPGTVINTNDVEFNVLSQMKGYGCGEHLVHYLDNITVDIEQN